MRVERVQVLMHGSHADLREGENLVKEIDVLDQGVRVRYEDKGHERFWPMSAIKWIDYTVKEMPF